MLGADHPSIYVQLLLLKSSFLQKIKRGIQNTNLQSDTVQITFFSKSCYLCTLWISGPVQLKSRMLRSGD